MWKNVFDRARMVKLAPFATHLGIPEGKSPCCGAPMRTRVDVSGCQRWSCNGCGYGGSAIDFAMTALKCDTGRAARAIVELSKQHPEMFAGQVDASRAHSDSVAVVLKGIVDTAVLDPTVKAYLMDRGIRSETVASAVADGWLRSLPAEPRQALAFLRDHVGDAAMACAGVPMAERVPALVYRPLVFVSSGGAQAEFRSIGCNASPSDSPVQMGEYVRPIVVARGSPTTAIIVDGGLEVLSLLDLGFSRDVLIVGLQNHVWASSWVDALMATYRGVNDWKVGTTPTAGGDARASALVDDLVAHGNFASRMAPPGGRDWNATLINAIDCP